MSNPVLVERWRGDAVEASHRGAFCAWRGDEVVLEAGDVDASYFVRSGAKYFQALAACLTGVVERFGLGDRELSLMCASHGGEAGHLEVAGGMLKAGGFTVEQLACGPHLPTHHPTASAMTVRGEEPTRLHSNCSGKHSGMMLASVARGAPVEGYVDPEHPHQVAILDVVCELAELDPSVVNRMIDGCSAPTFNLPLRSAARAFRNFGDPPASMGDVMGVHAAALRAAVAAQPFMLAGNERFCTALIEASGGRILCKVGADGFYGAFCADQSFGVALHVDDGNMKATEHLLAGILRQQGLLSDDEFAALGAYVGAERRNHDGLSVGETRVILP